MWIVTNKSFLSIVEDRNDNSMFVVRARISGDLEKFFDGENVKVIESSDSDYRFRVFASKDLVRQKLVESINSINYSNFKNSVKDYERKSWYTRIWHIMFDVQEKIFGPQKWWETAYYNDKNTKEHINRNGRG